MTYYSKISIIIISLRKSFRRFTVKIFFYLQLYYILLLSYHIIRTKHRGRHTNNEIKYM